MGRKEECLAVFQTPRALQPMGVRCTEVAKLDSSRARNEQSGRRIRLVAGVQMHLGHLEPTRIGTGMEWDTYQCWLDRSRCSTRGERSLGTKRRSRLKEAAPGRGAEPTTHHLVLHVGTSSGAGNRVCCCLLLAKNRRDRIEASGTLL